MKSKFDLNSSKMKNVKVVYAKELASGKVIVCDIMDTSVAGQKRLQVAQEIESENSSGVGILQGTPNKVILTAFTPIAENVLVEKGIKKGSALDDAFAEELKGKKWNISVEESTQPFTYLEDGRTPRVNRNAKMNKAAEDGGQYLTRDGGFIFRRMLLNVGNPNHIKVQHNGQTSNEPDYDAMDIAVQEANATKESLVTN